MSHKANRFSFERHQDAASMLVRLRQDLKRLGEDINRSYGADAALEADEAIAALDRVREMLDIELDRDYPRDSGQVCNVRLTSLYYPPRRDEHRAA
jgi:hypothetical protein